MLRRIALITSLIAALGVSAGPQAARASNNVKSVLKDCAAHGKLTRRYSRKTLRKAKRQLKRQAIGSYTGCSSAINKALHKNKHRRRRKA